MDYAAQLRSFFQHLVANDRQVAEKLDRLQAHTQNEGVQRSLGALSDLEGIDSPGDLAIETIVSRVGRPVLEVQENEFILAGPETEIWQARLDNDTARSTLRKIIPAIGRIEVAHHRLGWLGTGWLASDDIVVTNRHVAEEFADRSGEKLVFRMGVDGQRMTANIDFHEEVKSKTPAEFSVLDILHIEESNGPDMAFLKIDRRGSGGRLAQPLNLATAPPASRDYVATIGYPAEDSRVPDQALVLRIFGDVYNVKRMAPGQVQKTNGELVTHDCSTLGGCSGSPVFRLDNGSVVGLHFSGLFLQENRSVSAPLIRSRLQKLGGLADRSLSPVKTITERTSRAVRQSTANAVSPVAAAMHAHESTWEIPLQVTVTIGQPTLMMGSEDTTETGAAARSSLSEAVDHAHEQVENDPNILAVREGYVFRDGWITKQRAVVVLVKGSQAREQVASQVHETIGGHPVEVRVAGPWDYLESQPDLESLEGVPKTAYKKPTDFKLKMVNEEMSVTCHVSPDAGWPTLDHFLSQTQDRLTIGMYDFTAPHIVQAVEDAVDDDSRSLMMVLQAKAALGKTGAKAKDVPEEQTIKRYKKRLKDRFRFVPASVGKGRQFASAYHIKVAVQDKEAFWLSSGNWQSSNQPETIDKTTWNALHSFNREWHVVVRCPALATQFEKYIRYDYQNAQRDADSEAAAPPELNFLVAPPRALAERTFAGRPRYFDAKTFEKKLKVMPLLTPDNYQEEVLKLIESAESQVLFQNQSLSLLADDKNDTRFAALAEALLRKQQDGLDVRIIMRGEFDVSRPLEQLQEMGFDMDRVQLQDHCHTKGIIVDGARVCVGSHNWTNQGTLVNRDASLIFHDSQIAQYYRDVFEFDWKYLTRQSVAESREVVPAGEARETTDDTSRLTLTEILLD